MYFIFILIFMFFYWIFSPFVTPRLCVIFVHTLAFIGSFFFQPDTNLFVYGHVEGWRREVWAVMLACQSVYTAALKPPTLNVWKCLVFLYSGGTLYTKCWWCGCTYRFVVSSHAKVTCQMRIVVGGDFVVFFILHLSFLIFRASAWSWRAGITKVRLSASLPWIFEFAIKEILVMNVMYDLLLYKADVRNLESVGESQMCYIR